MVRRAACALAVVAAAGSTAGGAPAAAAPAPAPAVQITDLGTLGGPWSHAAAINEAGQIVGTSETATGARRAFSWTPAGGMVDLGSLGGGRSDAVEMNDRGQVIGTSTTAAGATHAFSWTVEGGMVDLGTLGGPTSRAVALNEVGQVVGTSETADGDEHAFLWSATTGMVDLGTLGGTRSEAAAINASGHVVGTSTTAEGRRRAVRWAPGGDIADLGTLAGGDESFARDISDRGQVVGGAYVFFDYSYERLITAFSWTADGGMVDIGFPTWDVTADGVTEGGEIIGTSRGYNSIYERAWFRTAEGERIDLPTTLGPTTLPAAFDQRGQVVGRANDEFPDRPFLWSRDGGLVELEVLLEHQFDGGAATDINERGQVVGRSPGPDGPRAVRWETVPAVVVPAPPTTVEVGLVGRTATVAFAVGPEQVVAAHRVRCSSATGALRTSEGAGTGPATVTFLTAGANYTCTVTVSDETGTSAPAWSAPFTVPDEPGAPSAPVVVAVGGSDGRAARLAITPAPPVHGAPSTWHRVFCASDDGGAPRSGSGAAAPVSVWPLTPGATYRCQARSYSITGRGPLSPPSAPFTVPAGR